MSNAIRQMTSRRCPWHANNTGSADMASNHSRRIKRGGDVEQTTCRFALTIWIICALASAGVVVVGFVMSNVL
jgi:hypothetical protein